MQTRRSSFSFSRVVLWGVALLMAVAVLFDVGVSSSVFAAEKATKKAKQEKGAEDEIPAPEEIKLDTADGLGLALTYYASTKGKQAIPVVMLHGLKQSRNDWKDLAGVLQKQGFAVIVPDLRGHGGSKRVKGMDKPLDAGTMPVAQFGAMVTKDMAAVKDFLREKNNDGELNIDKLCVLGAEMGASVAINFAIADAIEQQRNTVPQPDYQIGKFVKALILLSPELSFRGLPVRTGNARIIPDVAMLILVGKENPKALKEADRIHGIFERYHPEPPEGDDKIDKKTLFFGKLDTSVQGTKLLDPNLNVASVVTDFLNRRLIKSDESKDWGWRKRQIPYQ
jgi:pimeloyl-ACP methyl ester carboxylesterase